MRSSRNASGPGGPGGRSKPERPQAFDEQQDSKREQHRELTMKRFMRIGAALLLTAGLVGPGLAKDVKIGLSWDARESALNQAWEDFMKAEAKVQGPPLGINVEWVVNMADNDSSRQAANIEDLLNSGVDIIIARALDAAAI